MSKETIYREDAIKVLDNAWINGTSLLDANEAVKQLKDLPSVNIVRCRECRYGQDDLFHMFCAYHHHKTYADDFCSYGEREGE